MYYDEKPIDGIWHWRGTPDGEWRPMTPEMLLNRRIAALEAENARLRAFAERMAVWRLVSDMDEKMIIAAAREALQPKETK